MPKQRDERGQERGMGWGVGGAPRAVCTTLAVCVCVCVGKLIPCVWLWLDEGDRRFSAGW